MVPRPTRREGRSAAEELVREAFWDLLAPGCAERDLLHRLRRDPASLPGRDWVALVAGRPVGVIACSQALVTGADGVRRPVATFGPIGVLPDWRGQGGLRPHRDHPPAGRRAGVRRGGHHRRPRLLPPLWLSHRQGLRHPPGRWALSRGPAGKKLRPGELSGISGRYCETEVFSLSPGDAGLRAFERGFPPKERVEGTPSQRRFARSIARLSPTTDR